VWAAIVDPNGRLGRGGQLREHPRVGPAFGRLFANMPQRRRPTRGDKWHLDEVLILSANSDGLRQGHEASHAGFGARLLLQPIHNAGHVYGGGRAGLLQPGFGQADVTAPAQAERAYAL
jgi:hypothetical protein